MVVDMHGTHADGCPRKQYVSHLQRHKAGNIRDERVNGEQHLSGVPGLHLLAVQQQMKMQILQISEFRFWHKFSEIHFPNRLIFTIISVS